MQVAFAQTQLVYKWEDSHLVHRYGSSVTIPETVQFVDMVWDSFNLQTSLVPSVCDGRGSPHARAYPQMIHLPKWGRNYVVLSHELAHCLCSLIDHDHNMGHGGIFLHLYFTILTRFLSFKYQKLSTAAIDFGLNVQRICIPKRFSRYLK